MKLEIQKIYKRFGKTRAVNNVSFALADGQSLGIVGESGSGKTTLAKIMMAFLKPDLGSVSFEGKEIHKFSREERAKKVQMIFQDPFASLNPKLLLGTQLLEGIKKSGPEEQTKTARQLMFDVGLSLDFLKRYPHQLSGGQRQRFAIARALSMNPELLIADEPVSSLDLSVQAQIINLLNSLRSKKNFMMIVISHDLAVIANLCQNVLVMKDGDVVEAGPMEEILNAAQSEYTRQLLAATPTV